MINLKLFTVLLFIGMIVSVTNAFTQVRVQMPDTLIPRGETYTLPVSGNLGVNTVNSLRIVVVYNSRVIDIKSARGGTGFAVQCPLPGLTRRFDKPDSSTVEITCDNINNTSTTLFELDVTALSGSDSVTVLDPVKIYINGNEPASPELRIGHIRVTGVPIFQKFPEGLGQNQPNPFTFPYETKFQVSINRPTNVSFDIFSSLGRQIASGEDEAVSITITSEKDGSIAAPGSVLETGGYLLTLKIEEPWNFSSGMYYLVMKTEKGVYTQNFILLK